MNAQPSPTLAALLALLDEREPLDVGPCPACTERGGGWEWSRETFAYVSRAARKSGDMKRAGWTVQRDWKRANRSEIHTVRAIRPCPECSEPGPEVECGACKGRGKAHVAKALRPPGHPDQRSGCVWADCPKCDGTGKRPGPPQPSGRDRRTPGQALRDALGLRWFRCKYIFGHEAEKRARTYAASLAPAVTRTGQVDPVDPAHWMVEELAFASEPDPAARVALLVYADGLQARGDILGKAIALALAGECRECEGSGAEWRPWEGGLSQDCPKCNGEGVAVGELGDEVRALHLRSIVDMPAKEPTPA